MASKKRSASVKRKTTETDISCQLVIDGRGSSKVKTGIGILDHMLELFAFWGFFDLELKVARGDLNIDIHHTNEDVGIVIGEVFKKALGNKSGIKRIGFASVPMEEVRASLALDISGRGFFSVNAFELAGSTARISDKDVYTFEYAKHFLESFSHHLGANLSIDLHGANPDLHTTLEPVFKALGLALDQATQIDPRRAGIPSTKGVID